MLSRCFATLYCCTSLLLCGMDLEIVFSKKPKKHHIPKRYKAYFQETAIDMLPTELKDHISSFIIQLSNVNFDTIDCYDKCIKGQARVKKTSQAKETGAQNKTFYCVCKDEPILTNKYYSPIYFSQSSPIVRYAMHQYPQRNLRMKVGPNFWSISIESSEKEIVRKKYACGYQHLLENSFSRHGNVFAMCSDDYVYIRTVNNGTSLYKSSLIGGCVVKVYFGWDEPVLLIVDCNNYKYKIYFDDSIKKLLHQTVFTWRQALLIGAIFENNAQYERSIIVKKSAEYYVFKGLDRKIRHFFKKYLNVKPSRKS